MENLICKKMIAIMKEISAIGKDNKNTMQNYKFRGIDDVYNELHNIFATHEVFCIPEVLETKTEERKSSKGGLLLYRIVKMHYTFKAEDGSQVSSIVEGEGMDSGDKALNKAMSAAHKYCLLQMFLIPTSDPKDSEIDSPVVASTEKQGQFAEKKKPCESYNQAYDLYLKYAPTFGAGQQTIIKDSLKNAKFNPTLALKMVIFIQKQYDKIIAANKIIDASNGEKVLDAGDGELQEGLHLF